jgi:hypothetical protein
MHKHALGNVSDHLLFCLNNMVLAEAPDASALLRGAPILFRDGGFYFKESVAKLQDLYSFRMLNWIL